MKCLKCGKEAFKEDYCNNCFVGIIKKRVRSYFRKTKCIKPNNKFIVVDDVSKWLLSNCTSFPIDVIDAIKIDASKSLKSLKQGKHKGILKTEILESLKSLAAKEKADAVLLPITLDKEVHDLLESLFSESFSTPKLQSPFISILTTITNEEVKRLCKLKKLKFEFEKEDPIYAMINNIEKKYRGKKFSLAKSLQELKELKF